MRPAMRHAALAAACLSALVLIGCGKHVDSNSPLSYAPADTPYLFANFKSAPADARQAWNPDRDIGVQASLQQLGNYAKAFGKDDPTLTKLLDAARAELANAKTQQDYADTVGMSPSALFAVYGIGDVPVARIQLASGEKFKAFWGRVEKRAGVTAPTGTVGTQSYWSIGGDTAKLRMLVAVEGDQLVVSMAPAHARGDLVKQLLGISKPSSNAGDRLARINSDNGYGDFGSGYLDLPRFFDILYSGKDAVTQEFVKDLGGKDLSDPACAGEFASLADQVPLASMGYESFSKDRLRMSVDVKLAPTLLGALTALKQPVPGMGAKSGDSMFDMVLALPLQKWQAFIKGRAEAAAKKSYQCPALQSLNRFAATAANPPVQMPPEAASLLGVRLILDKWEIGPRLAGRVLVASSDPAGLARKIQGMPQFAMKTIATDGKPVAFDLPAGAQSLFVAPQGWVAANSKALVAGLGEGEEARLADALNAPAGDGDTLLRMHMDGKLYAVSTSWVERLLARMPATSQVQAQHTIAVMQAWSKLVKAQDSSVQLDGKGLHFESTIEHQ